MAAGSSFATCAPIRPCRARCASRWDARAERRAAAIRGDTMSGRRIVFLDRDGTLNEETADEQIDSLDKIRLMPASSPRC